MNKMERQLWVNRLQAAKDHMRIVKNQIGNSSDSILPWIGRQMAAGIAEMDTYIADSEAEEQEEGAAA